jgi:hypothetical protein
MFTLISFSTLLSPASPSGGFALVLGLEASYRSRFRAMAIEGFRANCQRCYYFQVAAKSVAIGKMLWAISRLHSMALSSGNSWSES